MKPLAPGSVFVAAMLAMLAMPAMADSSTSVATATYIARQYCDDTWRALSTVAIAQGDPDIDRPERIVSRLTATVDDGLWGVIDFLYPHVSRPVMTLMGKPMPTTA